jgi:hypothetical protein
MKDNKKKAWILHMANREYVYKYIDYGPYIRSGWWTYASWSCTIQASHIRKNTPLMIKI